MRTDGAFVRSDSTAGQRSIPETDPDSLFDVSGMELVLYIDDNNAAENFQRACSARGLIASRAVDIGAAIAELRARGVRVLVYWHDSRPHGLTTRDLKQLRSHGVRAPIVVVVRSATVPQLSEIRSAGADDVVEAIRGNDEIILRGVSLARVVRRYAVEHFSGGTLVLDHMAGMVHCSDSGEWRSVHMSRQAMAVLSTVAGEEGRTVSHAVVDRRVFGRDMSADRGKRALAKQKVNSGLKVISRAKTMVSVRGVGYQLQDEAKQPEKLRSSVAGSDAAKKCRCLSSLLT